MAGVLTPAGQLVATGGALTNMPADYDFATVRYTSNGTLDPSFGGDGIVKTALTGATASYRETGIAVQPDGKTIVAGDLMQATASGVIGVARYNVDGSLDSTILRSMIISPVFSLKV